MREAQMPQFQREVDLRMGYKIADAQSERMLQVDEKLDKEFYRNRL